MKVRVDPQKCAAAGCCALSVPKVFGQREEDGVVVLLQDKPPAELHEQVQQAREMCPARAIEVTEV
jgi:ferredoxin